jgi:hypothetical protein
MSTHRPGSEEWKKEMQAKLQDWTVKGAIRQAKLTPPPKDEYEAGRRLKALHTKPRKYSNPEGQIQKSILQYLHLKGIWAWITNRKGRQVNGRWIPSQLPSGHSDVMGILPGGIAGKPGGTVLMIEVKDVGKKPTPEQLAFMARVNALGGLAFWADSVETVVEKIGLPLR